MLEGVGGCWMSCIRFGGYRFLMAGSTPGGTGQALHPSGPGLALEGGDAVAAIGLAAAEVGNPLWALWVIPPFAIVFAATSGKSCHMEDGIPWGKGGSLLRAESSISRFCG